MNKIKYIKIQENKKKEISFFRIAFLLIFLISITYLSSNLAKLFSNKKVKVKIIEFVEYETFETYNGIIVRDEKIYQSNKSGFLVKKINNLDVVKNNSIVCYIKDRKDLNYRNKILINKNDKENENLIDLSINNFKNNDIELANNFMDIFKYEIDIDSSVEKSEEKNNKNLDAIFARESGIIVYDTDGYENIIDLKNINGEFSFYNLKNKKNMIDESELRNKDFIEKDRDAFKIIRSNVWYVLSYINNNDSVFDLNKNDETNIWIEKKNNFVKLNCSIEKIIKKDNNKSILIIKLDKNIQDFIKRNIKFRLGYKKFYGYKILKSSIETKKTYKIKNDFIDKNKSCVTRINGEKVDVKILDSNKNFCYVESDDLKINDVLLLNKNNNNNKENSIKFSVENTKKIYGIYIANTGIAEFIRLNFGSNDIFYFKDKNFIIINTKLNNKIKIYDSVVVDHNKVKSGDKIID
ncbi:MAG: hypothetical protein LBJ93_02585 [Clostridiales bacterium]|nr:hypothetical protein [Clostridiales bacterium]